MRKLIGRRGRDELAVTQYCDAIADFEDLFKAMGHIQHGNVLLLLKPVDELQERTRILFRERGRRLVKNHDASIGPQHFGDLYHLTSGDRQT